MYNAPARRAAAIGHDARMMWTHTTWGAITRLHEEMEMGDAAMQFGQAETRAQLQALYRSVHEIAVTLGVTMEILAAANLLDPEAIRTEVAKRLADKTAVLAACIQCGKPSPANQMSSTPMGAVCAACAGT
jgi:hypothetical protein